MQAANKRKSEPLAASRRILTRTVPHTPKNLPSRSKTITLPHPSTLRAIFSLFFVFQARRAGPLASGSNTNLESSEPTRLLQCMHISTRPKGKHTLPKARSKIPAQHQRYGPLCTIQHHATDRPIHFLIATSVLRRLPPKIPCVFLLAESSDKIRQIRPQNLTYCKSHIHTFFFVHGNQAPLGFLLAEPSDNIRKIQRDKSHILKII